MPAVLPLGIYALDPFLVTLAALLRKLFLVYPAHALDALWWGYQVLLAAAVILCFVSVTLWVMAWAVGIPLP